MVRRAFGGGKCAIEYKIHKYVQKKGKISDPSVN